MTRFHKLLFALLIVVLAAGAFLYSKKVDAQTVMTQGLDIPAGYKMIRVDHPDTYTCTATSTPSTFKIVPIAKRARAKVTEDRVVEILEALK